MTLDDIKNGYLCSGDYVSDPFDNGGLRQVDHIEGTTVYMTDGGFMGIYEIDPTGVFLESEIE